MIDLLQHNNLKWIHLSNPSDYDYDFLIKTYNFHHLDIEDCKSKRQRPKVDIYDEYYFIILHFPYFDKVNKNLVTKEVKIFWGKDYVISVGKSHWIVRQMFNELKENALLKNDIMSSSSDKLLYHILDRLLIESHTILTKIGDEVELLNRDLFNKKPEKIIERISVTRKNIILLNTINKPQLRLFQRFESGVIKGFAGDEMEDYWGNILDGYSKNWDLIEDYGELIAGLSTTFDSLQANKINEIMKVLTFFSSIMLPLTFVTGLYGMNIGLPLQGQPYAFLVVVGSMMLIVGSLLMYFKKKHWI